jgi:DNA-binding NarL/FixJ family response regulator
MLPTVNIKLFVVEPNALRQRLLAEVAGRAGVEIAGSAASLEEAFNADKGIEVFLISTDAIGEETGYVAALAGERPAARVVLFGAEPGLDLLLALAPVRIGGYLAFNHLSDEEFGRSLDIIAHGGAVIEPLTASLLLDYLAGGRTAQGVPAGQAPSMELTSREEEVVEHVRRGLSNKEIAREMGISLGTVRAHLRSIFRKLEVSSRAGAAAKSLSRAAPRGDLSHTA